jgi:hypothetical protein
MNDNSRLFIPPQIPQVSGGTAFIGPDPAYVGNYYCIPNDGYLDVRSDNNDYRSLTFKEEAGEQHYRAFISEYFEYSARLPSTISRVNYLGLVPSTKKNSTSSLDVGFGRSLDGISFKNDQIKLRVFYSIPK